MKKRLKLNKAGCISIGITAISLPIIHYYGGEELLYNVSFIIILIVIIYVIIRKIQGKKL